MEWIKTLADLKKKVDALVNLYGLEAECWILDDVAALVVKGKDGHESEYSLRYREQYLFRDSERDE